MEIIDNSKNYRILGDLEVGSIFELGGGIYLLTDNYEDKYGGGNKWECISLSHCGISYYFDNNTLVVPRTGKIVLES